MTKWQILPTRIMEFNTGAAIVSAIVAIVALVVSMRNYRLKANKEIKQEVKEDGDIRSDMELKIQALRGEMESNYKELTARLSGIETAMTEVRVNNSSFETRILSGVDKLENKIERLQDLMVKAVLSNNQTNK